MKKNKNVPEDKNSLLYGCLKPMKLHLIGFRDITGLGFAAICIDYHEWASVVTAHFMVLPLIVVEH